MMQHEHLARVVSSALRQEGLSGIIEILKNIAESVDAYGCILWESNKLTSDQLFVLASWFGDRRGNVMELPLHQMPLEGSANGLAIRTQEIQNVASIKDDPRTFKHPVIVEEAKFTSMCAVPINFDEGQGEVTEASLGVYRNQPDHPFSKEEELFIQQMAELIPHLYRAIRDNVGRILLGKINQILDGVEVQANNNVDSISIVKRGLHEVCKEVADTLQCVETTIFLENRLVAENVFDLFATTWPKWSVGKKFYLPKKEEGLTGWVLENKRAVRIFNLATFDQDKTKLRLEYPDIDWKDSLKIKLAAREVLDLPEGSDLPPLSFMAAPIIRGNKLLGVIRCCTAREAPWFFGHRQLTVLKIVASIISRFWNAWVQHLEEQEENSSWQTLVNEISNLNHVVQSEFARPALEDRLYERILNIARRVIRGADILDIRLHDEANNQLYFAKWLGSAWERRGSKQDILGRINKRFRLDGPTTDNGHIGIKAFKEGKVQFIMNGEKENYHSQTFPETKRIVVAPIGVKKKIIGLLDVRGTSHKPFTKHTSLLAEILGRQLGLYLSLRQNEQQQRQVFEDLFHQLKGPVRQTFARAESLAQKMVNEQWHLADIERVDEIEYELKILRGVARKAKRVTFSAGLFRDLAIEGKLQLAPRRLKSIHYDELMKLLKDTNIDTQHALEDEREIRFRVVEESFKSLSDYNIKVDFDLLEQAANCLLDNAGKYSFSNTLVTVSFGEKVIDEGTFTYIAVKNKGFVIPPEEVTQCKERNYRGEWAKRTTGEGSGIGLWVVDHIMKAHKGVLEIVPTTMEGWTEVRLLFPVSN